MIRIRPSNERGHANHGWLDTYHTFSFADYHDPKHMHFRSLRVINEDHVAPSQGFGTHPHRDMEIITYVLEGALEHKDSLGTRGVIRPGEIQVMSAGTGIMHSEFNHSDREPVHLLQIWIMPATKDLKPRYDQRAFPVREKTGQLHLLASHKPTNGAVKIFQDVDLYAAALQKGDRISHSLRPGRHAWLQVVRGEIQLNGTRLQQGDGAAVSTEEKLDIGSGGNAEFLLFDLA